MLPCAISGIAPTLSWSLEARRDCAGPYLHLTPGLLPTRVPRKNKRCSGQVLRENLEQQMLADFAGFVDDSVADISRFKEIVSSTIRDCLVRQYVLHLPHCHLSDPGPQVIMSAHISSWSNRYLSNPQFVLTLQLWHATPTDRRLVEDLCRDTFRINFQWLVRIGLCYKSHDEGKHHDGTKLPLHGSSF